MEELSDKLPFHLIISGATNCGKTHYLLQQLRGPFRYMFEYIVLICPTYMNNKTYHGFAKNDLRFIVVSPDVDSIDEINDILLCCKELFTGTNSLIILDDCAFSKDLKQRSNNFINLAFSGRHEGLSVWVLTQQLTSIAKAFRDNVACVISFYNPSTVSMKALFDDFGGDIDIVDKKKYMKLLKSEKYSRICMCMRHPYYCYIELPSSKDLNND